MELLVAPQMFQNRTLSLLFIGIYMVVSRPLELAFIPFKSAFALESRQMSV